MMEYRESGLPMNQPDVHKAFYAWRLNAKDYAEMSGLKETYTLEVAQLIHKIDPAANDLMKLALLITVPEPAWGIMEKRFGAETVDKLEEMAKHVRTGYAYSAQASGEIKALAMAAGIKAFDEFIKTSDDVNNTFSLSELGASPEDIVRRLRSPECKMYERIADKIEGSGYPLLEKAYAEKLAEYHEARASQNAQLTEAGMPFDDEDEAELRAIPFDKQGLIDAPETRKAYEILLQDPRVSLNGLANALSVGRLLTELPDQKDTAVIAAGMIDAAIARRSRDDAEFLGKMLPKGTMDVLNNYDIDHACTRSAEGMTNAPPAVRQLAMAKGLVLLDMGQKQCEQVMEYISSREDALPPGVAGALKADGLEPLKFLAAIVPKALAPIMNKTGSRQLEQLFDAQVKGLNKFVSTHTPESPAGVPGGGRITFRRVPKPGKDFGM